MRLIDADTLFNWGKYELTDAVKYGNKDAKQRHFSYSTLMMYEIADEIDDAPTIDAVPVVRGEWIEKVEQAKQLPQGYSLRSVKCSICGETPQFHAKTNYCPNCGAKMDGGK